MLGNGKSRSLKTTEIMEVAGNNIADLVEKNTLRKDDYEVNRPDTDDEFDLLQFNNKPETAKYRGFQMPAGFMAVASGLDKWGYQERKNKIAYTHLDVSASVGVKHMECTGTPTSLFISRYILPKVNSTKFPLEENPAKY
ncbi:unnamed protein product [Dibothriocephalus latus]|uniref:Cytosol aminopeptidase domain-containing protein n=1 Tax=Dibothriocephalus latus TaxID=60516 RepID=A0A3P7MFI5_DIBLA|nr:unnamed protein product [Dibothriocephalus latus]